MKLIQCILMFFVFGFLLTISGCGKSIPEALRGNMKAAFVIAIDEAEFKKQHPGLSQAEFAGAVNANIHTVEALLDARLRGFGVFQFFMEIDPSNKIHVTVKGINSLEPIKNILAAGADLRFHLVLDQKIVVDLVKKIDEISKQKIKDKIFVKNSKLYASVPRDVKLIDGALHNEKVKEIMPPGISHYWSDFSNQDPSISFVHRYLYFVKDEPTLTGAFLEDAFVQIDETAQQPRIHLQFNKEGSRLLAQTTNQNIGGALTIIFNNNVISAPIIKNEIRGGQIVLSGFNSYLDAKKIVALLRVGELPAPLILEKAEIHE